MSDSENDARTGSETEDGDQKTRAQAQAAAKNRQKPTSSRLQPAMLRKTMMLHVTGPEAVANLENLRNFRATLVPKKVIKAIADRVEKMGTDVNPTERRVRKDDMEKHASPKQLAAWEKCLAEIAEGQAGMYTADAECGVVLAAYIDLFVTTFYQAIAVVACKQGRSRLTTDHARTAVEEAEDDASPFPSAVCNLSFWDSVPKPAAHDDDEDDADDADADPAEAADDEGPLQKRVSAMISRAFATIHSSVCAVAGVKMTLEHQLRQDIGILGWHLLTRIGEIGNFYMRTLGTKKMNVKYLRLIIGTTYIDNGENQLALRVDEQITSHGPLESERVCADKKNILFLGVAGPKGKKSDAADPKPKKGKAAAEPADDTEEDEPEPKKSKSKSKAADADEPKKSKSKSKAKAADEDEEPPKKSKSKAKAAEADEDEDPPKPKKSKSKSKAAEADEDEEPPKPKKSKSKSKAAEADEDEEPPKKSKSKSKAADADEDEEPPKKSKSKSKSKAAEADADEEPPKKSKSKSKAPAADEDDEEPPKKSKSKSKAKAAAADEDDEDDEEPPKKSKSKSKAKAAAADAEDEEPPKHKKKGKSKHEA